MHRDTSKTALDCYARSGFVLRVGCCGAAPNYSGTPILILAVYLVVRQVLILRGVAPHLARPTTASSLVLLLHTDDDPPDVRKTKGW